ncbi:hypothetical protein GE061_014386 [Apolygus lucorum]|uniref:Uncharacterized protein n=1 Tax=Apolygus lucorum TaxID=248454 RepID=A0A6A4K4E4_APOLU|nr:hypothetical protein GE061_014386 [Apolygus lucorum]
MFLRKFDCLVLCAKERRALRLENFFNTKHVISRNTQSIRRDRKSQAENDSGIIDPNLTMWRSINSEHKEVEQVPTDQTENIMNYYKDRWVQEHKERKDVETISGTEVSREAGAAEKKSLYSQLARKSQTGNNPMMGKSFGPMNGMGHMGNIHLGSQPDDPSMVQYDPMKLQKTVPYGPLQDVENKERSQNKHRQSDSSSGGFWSSQRTPYNVASGSQPDTQIQQRYRETKQDHNGPYRPSFSMADLVGSKPEGSKMDKEGSINTEMKSNKRPMNHETTKEDNHEDSSSSLMFKPAAPPVPDFKQT